MPTEDSDDLTVQQAIGAFINRCCGAASANGQSPEEYIVTMSSLLDESRPASITLQAEGWLIRGNACFAIGRFHEASRSYAECLRMDPDNETANKNKRYSDVLKDSARVADLLILAGEQSTALITWLKSRQSDIEQDNEDFGQLQPLLSLINEPPA